MISNLNARLTRLEADRVPSVALETSFSPALRMLRLLIAVHLGDMQRHEPVAAGLVRVLGYGTVIEMRSAMQANRETVLDWGNRHTDAAKRLIGDATGITESRAELARLFEDLPAWARAHSFAVDPDLDTAAEWVSL